MSEERLRKALRAAYEDFVVGGHHPSDALRAVYEDHVDRPSATPESVPIESWRWRGTPGHFVGAYSCCFHLHTTIGSYRITSVGCYHPGGDRSAPPHEIGSQRLYETMVFKNGPDGEPDEWLELDGDAYNDAEAAQAGHLAMCCKWAARASLTPESL